MASEKASMSQDTESLPPQYASSEGGFSDSPPPAYRKTNTVRLQITRIVCATVLLSGFLVGFFILSHTWITNSQACNCPETFDQLPTHQRLVQASVLPVLGAVEDIAPKIPDVSNQMEDTEEESRQLDIPLPLDNEKLTADLEIAEKVIEEEVASLQDVGEEGRRVRLPIDMLLGNPALAGKDTQCKVEKKVQNLGNGILSKTIMVTCDDEDDEEKHSAPMGQIQVKSIPFGQGLSSEGRPMGSRPPMSLLAPILKMMASRANARLERQRSQPKLILRRFPQSMGPFPLPFKGPVRFVGQHGSPNMNGPPPPPTHFRSFPPMSHAHGHMISGPPQSGENSHMPFDNMREDEDEQPPKNMLFREDFDREQQPEPLVFRRFPMSQPDFMQQQDFNDREEMTIRNESPVQVIRGFPPQMQQQDFNDREEMTIRNQSPIQVIRGFPPHMQQQDFNDREEMKIRNQSPIQVIRGFPPHMQQQEFNDREDMTIRNQSPIQVIRGFPPHMPHQDFIDREEMTTRNENPVQVIRGFPPQIPDAIKQIVSKIIEDGEGSSDDQDSPRIAFKSIPQMRSFDDLPAENKMMLPFPFRAVKVQSRGARKLNLDEDFSSNSAFPLPRGAMSAAIQPVFVPEAGGRALDSPVTIPAPQESSPLRFFPGGLVRVPLPLPEGRALTHMEMQEFPTNEIPIETEDTQNQQQIEQTENLNTETMVTDVPVASSNFGPPKDDSVIEESSENGHLLGSPDEMPSFLTSMPPPPPPQYAREARSGIVEELNPDAEMIHREDVPEHHILSMTK